MSSDQKPGDGIIVGILKNGTTSPHIITTIPEQVESTSINEPFEEPLLVNGNGHTPCMQFSLTYII